MRLLRHSILALACLTLTPALADAQATGPDLDIVSKPWMAAAQFFADCGATAAMASGETGFLDGMGYLDEWGITEDSIRENNRLYMLQFDLGEDFSEDELRDRVDRIAAALRSLHDREAGAEIPEPHAKLLAERRSFSFSFGRGFTSTADADTIQNRLSRCARVSGEWLGGTLPDRFIDAE